VRDTPEMARKFLWGNIHNRFIRKYGAAKPPKTDLLQKSSLYNLKVEILLNVVWFSTH
jgi:hypothetical protein